MYDSTAWAQFCEINRSTMAWAWPSSARTSWGTGKFRPTLTASMRSNAKVATSTPESPGKLVASGA